MTSRVPVPTSQRTSDPVSGFVPLARLTLGDGFEGTRRERWVRPLAQLLEAASRGVGQLPLSECVVDDSAPPEFFAIEGGSVFLPRYAACWREVRSRIEALYAQERPELWSDAAVREALDAILPPLQIRGERGGPVIFDNAEQRLAAAALVDARIGVVTGGPGTGKTTSAAALLAIRKRLCPSLSADDVLLCAPTGKAACRLSESVKGAASRLRLQRVEREFLCALVPRTIHRALEWGPKPPEQGGPFRRGALRPLTQKLVLVDEASMVDLDLMTHLLRALSPEASLILLGDSDQLESVETGGVLGELVSRGGVAEMSVEALERWSRRLGSDVRRVLGEGAERREQQERSEGPERVVSAANTAPLPGLVVRLRHSYRAQRAPWILELAAIAKPGADRGVADFVACCRKCAPSIRLYERRRDLYAVCRERWREAERLTDRWSLRGPPESDELGEYLRRFQLLCGDNAQVDRANRIGIGALQGGVLDRGGLGLPHGCPVLVLQNRPTLGLSNGDVGVALGTTRGSRAQVVVFPGGDAAPTAVAIAQLPEHQPAFALTIHKSQGSEWRRIAIDLPEESRLLDRNLLYTAITRSSGTLDLFVGGESTLGAILGG